MRTIDKVGGLDEYLLGEKSARIRDLGMEGWRLRCMIMGTKSVQERFNAQRRALGLPEVDYAALALEATQLDAEMLDMIDESEAEFVVEPDDYVEEVAIGGGDAYAAQQGISETFADKVQESKNIHAA